VAAHELLTSGGTSCIAQRGEGLLSVSYGGLSGVYTFPQVFDAVTDVLMMMIQAQFLMVFSVI